MSETATPSPVSQSPVSQSPVSQSATSKPVKKCPPKFLNFLSWVIQHYFLNGDVPDSNQASEQGFPVGMYEEAFASEGFKQALATQAIIDRNKLERPIQNVLSWDQLRIANILTDITDTRSLKKKLQDNQTSTRTYQAWLKDAAFRGYMLNRSRQLMEENQHEVAIALMDQIRAGNLKAIEYYNEWNEVFTRQTSGFGNSNGGYGAVGSGNHLNFQIIIANILEIITKHIHDSDTLLRIHDDLESLMRIQGLAQGLAATAEVLPIPQNAGEATGLTLAQVTTGGKSSGSNSSGSNSSNPSNSEGTIEF